MRARIFPVALLATLSGCALLQARPEAAREAPAAVSTARAIHLARVKCLLLAPFENTSDDPLAAEAATAAFVSGIDPNRTSVYSVGELRAIFKNTSLELPEGISPSLALELAELIGADAALYGAVEGRSRGTDPAVTISIRLAATGARDLLFAKVVELVPRPEEDTAEVVRRAILQAAAPMLERLGVPGRKVCFDRQRTDRLRFMALAGEQKAAFPPRAPVTAPLPPAPAPTPALAPERQAPGLPEGGGAAQGTAPAQADAARVVEGTQPAIIPAAPEKTESTLAEIGVVEILPPIKRPRPWKTIPVESGADLPESTEAVAAPPAPAAGPAAGSAKPVAKAAAKVPKREKKVAAVTPKAPKGNGGLTVRQAEALMKLQTGARFLLADVTFVGRTAQLEREGGLHDVVAMLGAAPALKLRIEGFVDGSNDPDADLRVSMEMARAAGKRLIELGVARDRLTWAGRGGDDPLLPNFTARGRTANRRLELVSGE